MHQQVPVVVPGFLQGIGSEPGFHHLYSFHWQAAILEEVSEGVFGFSENEWPVVNVENGFFSEIDPQHLVSFIA